MPRKHNDWIDAYMEYVHETEPPLLYKKWVAIFTVAAVLQRKCFMHIHEDIYPNLYIVLVGRSGRCRKGTAIKPGENLLRAVGVNLAADATTKEALVKDIDKAGKSYINQDTGLVIPHASISIISKELTVFLKQGDIDFLSWMTDLYDCGCNWDYRTKTQGEDKLTGVWVNLLGATTPDMIQTAFPRDAAGLGFTSRVVFVYEHRKEKSNPFVVLDQKLAESLQMDLEQMLMLGGPFTYTEEFLETYIDWYNTTENEQDNTPLDEPMLDAYWSRRPVHLQKLCMVLSAARGDKRVITIKEFQDSLTLLEQTERKMAYAFRGVGKSRIADVQARILAYIATKGEVMFSELMSAFFNDVSARDLAEIVITLDKMHEVRQFPEDRDTKIKYVGRLLTDLRRIE